VIVIGEIPDFVNIINIMSISNDCGDVEMFTLRRSSRLAEKERQKFLNNLNYKVEDVEEPKTDNPSPSPKSKTSRKKSDVVKMSVDKKAGVNTKKKTRKGKKTNKKVNKFINLETTKINDVFPLIHKYSRTDSERIEKYILLETIIKFRNDINISNLMTDVYINRAAIERYVYLHLSQECNEVTLMTISNHLSDILSYKEIDDLDTVVHSKYNHNEPQDCDNLVQSLNMMKIDNKQVAEQQMKNDLDEIEKLNFLICRLIT
jgi:hypothetical protein